MTVASLDPIALTVTRSSVKHHNAAVSGQGRLNDGMALALVIFLVLVAIPLGANRPFFWAANALAVGGMALVYALMMMRSGADWRVSIGHERLLVGCWIIILVFLILQALPLGIVLGSFSFVTRSGVELHSEAASLAPGATLHMAMRLFTYGVFFFIVVQMAANDQRAKKIAAALFAIIWMHAAYGLLALTQLGDSLLFFEKWAYLGAATGTFVNRNSYATLLAFGMVLGLVSALRNAFADPVHRGRNDHILSAVLYLTGTVFIAAALIATQSRMGLFAGVTGCAFTVLVIGLKLQVRRPGAFQLGLGLTLALCVGAFFLFGTGTLERLGSAERDFDVRFQLYGQVFDMIVQRPILGFGGGSFEIAYPLVHALPVSPDLVWDRAHSTYLTLWSELGVVWGSLMIAIVALMGWKCAGFVRKRSQDWWLPLVSLGVIVVSAVHSLVDFSLEIQANTFFLLALIGLGFANSTQPEARR